MRTALPARYFPKLAVSCLAFMAASLISPLALALADTEAATSEKEAFAIDRSQLIDLEPKRLMAMETQSVIEMLETMHFNFEEIDNEAFRKLIEEYMSALDYNRLFFLAAHKRKFMERHGQKIGFELRNKGNLSVAFEIYEQYRELALDRIEWVLQRLDQGWSFAEDESYVYDRSEEAWPESMQDADNLWNKRLKQELLKEILNEKEIDDAKEIVAKRYRRMVRNIKEFGAKSVQEVFLTRLTQMFDPHSTFFSSDTFEDFNIQMRLSLVGIGAMLSEEDGYCVIKELIAGGPAKLSQQLQPEDRIVAVAQEGEEPFDIIGMSLRKVVNKIRGKKGTTVSLTIIPADAVDESERKVVNIVRDVVRINSSRASASIFDVPLSNGTVIPIGVIDIPSFYGSEEIDDKGNRVVTSVSTDVEELALKMRDVGVQGIVLDLRRNGGGLLEEAIRMTGLFIRRGPVVQVRDHYGRVDQSFDRDPKLIYTGPLAVLTSRYSASASEIVAGALQNYGRAIIIGNSSTHGKGTVQHVFSLRDYIVSRAISDDQPGAAKLTIRKFYLPNGFSTQRKGVVSDIQLPSIEEIIAEGEGDLPNALAWDYVKPASSFTEMALRSSFIDKLQIASKERRISLEEFSFLHDRINWYQEREERKEISLNLETRKRLMETDKEFLDQMKERQRALASFNYNENEIKLDSVLKDETENEAPEVTPEEPATSEIDSAAGEIVASDGEGSIPDSEETSAEEDEDPVPAFDIQLRETLRIMADAVQESPNPRDWREPASPLASKSRFESLLN